MFVCKRENGNRMHKLEKKQKKPSLFVLFVNLCIIRKKKTSTKKQYTFD